MALDRSLLEAALLGYKTLAQEIQGKIAELKGKLSGRAIRSRAVPSGQQSGKRRTMSAAARKRIAAAQKKRWAEWHAKQA